MPIIGCDYQNFFGPSNPLWYAILAKVYILPQYANYKKDPARYGPPKLHLPRYAGVGLFFLAWASIFSKRDVCPDAAALISLSNLSTQTQTRAARLGEDRPLLCW